MRTLTLFGALCIFLCAVPASAKVAIIQIEELVARSDVIVVATVTGISPSPGNRHVSAGAVVERTLKGSMTGTFRFLASPTWTCDVSTAVQGETVLLFLKRRPDGHFIIGHSGRGRMPLRTVGDKTYVTLWTDVQLPSGAPTIAGPDSNASFLVAVELGYLEALISEV
jgi:hypothetical protein